MSTRIPVINRSQVSRRRALRLALGAGWLICVLGFAVEPAAAWDLTPWAGRPATERIHFQGNQFNRAGNPECISPLAGPSESKRSVGYYVGGGARVSGCLGEERRHEEGTWGTDYEGLVIRKKIDLRWSHGKRYQGGVGSYPTDGPRLIHKP
jgi:hypothetical protein